MKIQQKFAISYLTHTMALQFPLVAATNFDQNPGMEVTPSSPPDRPPVRRPKDPQRSRIANGSAWLSGVDQRTLYVRRCRELFADYISDLGGFDNTSAGERSILRRAVTHEVELERYERKFALAGEANEHDFDLYIRGSGNHRRLLETIGLERRARDVTTTLGQILRAQGDDDA